jgi:hypothetical protein
MVAVADIGGTVDVCAVVPEVQWMQADGGQCAQQCAGGCCCILYAHVMRMHMLATSGSCEEAQPWCLERE